MTRERWNQLCAEIFQSGLDYEMVHQDMDWQPENIHHYIESLRNEANALEELTRVYQSENKGVNNGNATS